MISTAPPSASHSRPWPRARTSARTDTSARCPVWGMNRPTKAAAEAARTAWAQNGPRLRV